MNGARSPEWYRRIYRDKSTSLQVAAASAGQAGVIAAVTGHTVYVQRIVVAILTSAAQTITFRDTAGSPVSIAIIPASAAVGTIYNFDFGARGVALTAEKGLDISGTAGPAYTVSVEAYARQTSALSQASAASS
jgi:hypothetical protein